MNQDDTTKIKSLIKNLIIENADHLTNQMYMIMKHHFMNIKKDQKNEQQTKAKDLKSLDHQKNKNKVTQPKNDIKQPIYIYKTKKEISLLDGPSIKEEMKKVFDYCTKISLRSHHTKSMKYMKQLMKQYSIKSSFIEYKQELVKNVDRCKKLCALKQYTVTRQNSLIVRMMTTIDVRLIRYSNYFEINVEQTDIDHFQVMIQNYLKINQYYDFHSIVLYTTLMIGLLPMNQILDIILPYSNIICKNQNNFYMLLSIKDKHREWRQDSYLTQFTLEFVNKTITAGIQLFRTIYKDIFEDNDYREDYKSKNTATDSDLQQILENIEYLNNNFHINQSIQESIQKHCRYTSLSDYKDKFDFESNLKQNYFFSENQSCLNELSKKLFDNVEGKNIFKLQ